MIFAVLLIIGAGTLLLYNSSESNRINDENLETVTELENILGQKTYEQNDTPNASTNFEQTSSEENYINSSNSITTINIKGINYFGILYIPELNNFTIPIIENCSNDNLKISACRYSGNLKENNLVIAGHNYKSTFGKLSKLIIGNIIYFKDTNGNVYKYNCKAIETLSPKAVSEMTTGDWDLTLFTCTYNGANRIAYRFKLEFLS